ncbi:hypothetical protein J6590_010423 [Homalodisca vitripennis]|nr:hypothetical protein J6590_010423 [Homalodisca vitripennis]
MFNGFAASTDESSSVNRAEERSCREPDRKGRTSVEWEDRCRPEAKRGVIVESLVDLSSIIGAGANDLGVEVSSGWLQARLATEYEWSLLVGDGSM